MQHEYPLLYFTMIVHDDKSYSIDITGLSCVDKMIPERDEIWEQSAEHSAAS